MDKTRARIAADLSNRILEIVDLDAPRSDVQGAAEALACQLAVALEASGRLAAYAAPLWKGVGDHLADALDDTENALAVLRLDI